MRLRPSGTARPGGGQLQAAFERYYAREAETWELLALTRARVVWAERRRPSRRGRPPPSRPRCVARGTRRARRADVRDMRALMARERPPSGFWDLKLAAGGLVDIEFAAQYLQIVHAAGGGPLAASTPPRRWRRWPRRGLAPAAPVQALIDAWRLQQDLSAAAQDRPGRGGRPERRTQGAARPRSPAPAAPGAFAALRPRGCAPCARRGAERRSTPLVPNGRDRQTHPDEALVRRIARGEAAAVRALVAP